MTLINIVLVIIVINLMLTNRTLNKHETAICELLMLHPELLEDNDYDT